MFRVSVKGEHSMTVIKPINGLSVEHTLELAEIFQQKGWDIEDGDHETSLYNRFCNTLARFEYDEQRLILDLTKRFLHVHFTKYDKELNNVLEKMNRFGSREQMVASKFYVMPLIAPRDKGKIKSSTLMAYLMKETSIKLTDVFAGKELVVAETLEALPKNFSESGLTTLILVDDYVGTGDTAVECLEYLFSNNVRTIIPEKVIVISLVAQEVGVRKIESLGVKHFTSILCKKGITDHYTQDKLETVIGLMSSIEAKIGVNDKFEFGYGRSEALVSMIRTPNNTFPVYWFAKNGITAPFPRN